MTSTLFQPYFAQHNIRGVVQLTCCVIFWYLFVDNDKLDIVVA